MNDFGIVLYIIALVYFEFLFRNFILCIFSLSLTLLCMDHFIFSSHWIRTMIVNLYFAVIMNFNCKRQSDPQIRNLINMFIVIGLHWYTSGSNWEVIGKWMALIGDLLAFTCVFISQCEPILVVIGILLGIYWISLGFHCVFIGQYLPILANIGMSLAIHWKLLANHWHTIGICWHTIDIGMGLSHLPILPNNWGIIGCHWHFLMGM